MKKVLFVASIISFVDKFEANDIKILQNMGYTVDAATNTTLYPSQHHLDSLRKKNVTVHHINFARSPFSPQIFKAYGTLKKIINKGNYDVIHCHTPVASILTRLICKKHRKKGLQVIYTAHGFHFFKGAPLSHWLLYYPIEKFYSRFTDILITINQEDYTLAKTKMKAKKVVYIHGVGVDTQKYADVVINLEEKCKELGLPIDCKILLSVGELNVNKNHQVVIRALAKLQDPSVHYVVAGTGTEKENLILLSEELGLSEQVHLLGYRRDIGELCELADVFCFPSRREGLSVALMEAMGSGLPCVTSKIRGNTDLIEDGKGGYFVDANSVEDFHTAIEMLLGDEDKRTKMGQYNQEAIKRFDIGNVDKEMRRVYQEVSEI